ncbi:hypothetical protein NGG46_12880, partial [Enterococcus faecium]|nr:hypothetical protein [Enterococcus faecium]
EKLGCQNFNSRSVKGLESRFESILLAYSVLLSRAQRRFEGTLWNGNSFFDKFYKVQNFFPYAIPIVLDNEPPRM